MQGKSYQEEIITLIVIGIIVFLVITSLMVFVLLFYQKKRFQHQRQLVEKDKEFSQQLLQSQLEIQEQTFHTISTEIHDNVGQILSLAKVQLNILDQGEVLDRSLLADAKESVSKAMTDLRDIAKGLNSERIRQLDLFENTEYELQRIRRSGLMTGSITTTGSPSTIAEQKKLIIFRMIQESLQNIVKHSRATNIDIVFNYNGERLSISIKDNGQGFDKTAIPQKDGLGLQNISNRAALVGGFATVDSTPGEGTTITITSPYEWANLHRHRR